MIIGDSINCEYEEDELIKLLYKRLENFFFLSEEEKIEIKDVHPVVLDRLKVCFQGIDNKYFKRNGKLFFSPEHSGQYLIYLTTVHLK